MFSAPPVLRSLGHKLDPGKLAYLTESNDILEEPRALRERLAEDGYLYIRRFFDPELILSARRAIFTPLAQAGEIDPGRNVMDGFVAPDKIAAFAMDVAPKFKDGYGAKTKAGNEGSFRPALAAASPEIRRVVFGPELCGFYVSLFGEPIRHFDFIWTRLMGPGHGTPTHCDWVYMGRGSANLLTCWIPYVEIPLEVGGLILLEKSHLQAERISSYLKTDVDAYCNNDPRQVKKVLEEGGWSHRGWLSSRPDTLPDKFESRWLTSEHWDPGDFLTFRMDLIHGSLDNQSDRLRFSTDTRYQPASEPADERWIGVNPPGHSALGP